MANNATTSRQYTRLLLVFSSFLLIFLNHPGVGLCCKPIPYPAPIYKLNEIGLSKATSGLKMQVIPRENKILVSDGKLVTQYIYDSKKKSWCKILGNSEFCNPQILDVDTVGHKIGMLEKDSNKPWVEVKFLNDDRKSFVILEYNNNKLKRKVINAIRVYPIDVAYDIGGSKKTKDNQITMSYNFVKVKPNKFNVALALSGEKKATKYKITTNYAPTLRDEYGDPTSSGGRPRCMGRNVFAAAVAQEIDPQKPFAKGLEVRKLPPNTFRSSPDSQKIIE